MLPYTEPPPYHSQWGEDRWLIENLEPPTHGTFVDVGAGDGVHGSNTLYFEDIGWRGLCVDADPRNHESLRRHRTIVEACAVASSAGRRSFGMHHHKPSWSGLQRHGGGFRGIFVDCRPLATLLRTRQIGLIDLLSIDVEGTELEVWNSFDVDHHRPSIVIIEFDDARPDRHRNLIHDHVGRKAYDLIHNTPANLILQRIERPWRRR